jgi:hypothetical protein
MIALSAGQTPEKTRQVSHIANRLQGIGKLEQCRRTLTVFRNNPAKPF